MKKFLLSNMCIVCIILCSCSADRSPAGTVENKESSSIVSGNAETSSEYVSNTETTATEEETSETDIVESTTEEEKSSKENREEPIVLTVYYKDAYASGILGSDINKTILDKFNVLINYYDWNDGTNAISHPEESLLGNNDIDIIMYSSMTNDYEKCKGEEINWKWDKEAYDTYGKNIQKYMSDSVEYVSSLSDDGGVYGFARKSDYYGELRYGTIYTIAATSKHKELCLQLLDWLVEPETILFTWYGPKGICWDIDEEGYYYLTETGYNLKECIGADLGEEYGGFHYMWIYAPISYISNISIPGAKHGETYEWTSWPAMQKYLDNNQ